MQQQPDSAVAFIGISEVKRISGLSKATVTRWVKAGKFPPPAFRDGLILVRWDLAQVLAWRDELIRKGSGDRIKAAAEQQAVAA